MKIIHIAAMSGNRSIGNNNDLPWSIPEDFKFFKTMTTGKILIMGRKTYESIPPTGLPNRHIVVVTRQADYKVDASSIVVASIEEAYKYCKTKASIYGDEIYIAGGAEIYRQTLKDTDLIYLTEIEKSYPGDAFYPEFSLEEFELTEKRDRSTPENFSFCTYLRKK